MTSGENQQFYSSKDLNELETVVNNELVYVLEYCAVNKLSINFKKTNYMLITSPRKNPSISITTCDIECTKQIKYLGVFIDNHLKWEPHIKHINNKLTKNIGILNKLRFYTSVDTLKQLYYTLVFPYINYTLLSWGTASQSQIQKIKTKQNNCIRSILFAHTRESVAPL